jgi:ribose 5-phosphate isomerase B
MKIAIGCDEAAFAMKETLKKFLVSKGHEVDDYGVYDETPVLYPDIAVKVSQSITSGKNERGVLVCGTGIGMAISANKVPGIRAAVGHDLFSVQRSRRSNDCQVITFGSRVIGEKLAVELLSVWLECEFEGGGSAEKVDKINEYDETLHRNCG